MDAKQDFNAQTIQNDVNEMIDDINLFFEADETIEARKNCSRNFNNFLSDFQLQYKSFISWYLMNVQRSARDADNNYRFSNAQFALLTAQSEDATDVCLKQVVTQYSPDTVKKRYNQCVGTVYQTSLESSKAFRQALQNVVDNCRSPVKVINTNFVFCSFSNIQLQLSLGTKFKIIEYKRFKLKQFIPER